MRCLVTGAAGFIGSHLAERLLDGGHQVTGLDCFTAYYYRALKEKNLAGAKSKKGFAFVEADLLDAGLARVLDGIDVVYHLAGQPGVKSFGPQFSDYIDNNLKATHRLLEAARDSRGIRIFVYASSASVYGDVPVPMREDGPTRPTSPYGITKLAAEQLCLQYAAQNMVPAMALRFFNVFGPRQRPDMAFTRLAVAALTGAEFPLYGTGGQERDFTGVGDIVDALVRAGEIGRPGLVLNVGGGHRVSLTAAIDALERISGIAVRIRREPPQVGAMERMEADTERLRKEFGFAPRVSLEEGLRLQLEWARENLPLLSKT